MADEITQALANRRRRAGQEYNLDQLDAEPGVLARLSRGEGLPTVASRRGLTPEEYDRREGTLSVPVRPGGDTVEQRVAKGVNDVATIAGVPRAINSVGEAIAEPTLGHIANAGKDVGVALWRPGIAIGSLAGGYGAAAGQQALTPSEASAAGLSPDQSKRKTDILKKLEAGGLNKTTRESLAEELRGLNKIETDAAAQENAARIAAEDKKRQGSQAEYDRRVKLAETVRDEERAKGGSYFDPSTPLGKMYRDTGGAPGLAFGLAGGFGAIDRLAKGAPKSWGDYARLGLEGFGGASLGMNAKLVSDAMSGPQVNPEKTAYEAYARELPDDHPEKQKWLDYAKNLPADNPVRVSAQAELYNPMKFAERAGMAAIEGIPGAWTGSNIPSALGAMGKGTAATMKGVARTAGELPGEMGTGYNQGMANAAKAGQARQSAVQQLHDAEQLSAQQRRLAAEAQQLEQASAQRSSRRSGQPIDGEVVRPDGGTQAGPVLTDPKQLQGQLPTGGSRQSLTSETPAPTGSNIAPAGDGNQALTAKIGELIDTLNRQAVGGDVAAAMQLRKLESQIAEAQKGNAEAMQALVTKIDQVGARGQKSATSLDDIWAEKYSPHARAIVGEHLDKSGTIVKGTYARDGGLTRQALDDEIAARAGGKGAGKSHTGARMDVLLDELERQGFGIPTLTGDQYRAALAKIDPRRFAVPVVIGATGGAAMIGGDDAMAGIDPSDRRFALARALMQAGAR